ncbi:MAG: hypothetical protein GC180_12050, partial [Bacteroidetes bacterium]|nr:hypothetical protein [Bacteroidota bacterium]
MNREMWLSDKNQEPYADRNCALCIDTTALFYTKIVENKYRQPEARIQHLLLPRLYKIGFGSVLVFRKFANPNHDHDTLLCNISQLNLAIPDNIRCIQWQDGSDTNEYEVTESGTYYVSGYNNRGCLVSDTIRIKM